MRKATINQGYRAANFGQELLFLADDVEVAIHESGSGAMRAPERFGTIEIKVATQVNAMSAESVVGTFKMTIYKNSTLGSHERTRIQSADERTILGKHFIALADNQLRLCDGRHSFGAVFAFVQRIHQIDIAIITHGQVFATDAIAAEMEHGEIAHGTLGLASVTGNYHIFGMLGQTIQAYPTLVEHHAEGCSSLNGTSNGGIVRIVNPIHVRCDVNNRRIFFRSRRQISQSFFQILVHVRKNLVGHAADIAVHEEGARA